MKVKKLIELLEECDPAKDINIVKLGGVAANVTVLRSYGLHELDEEVILTARSTYPPRKLSRTDKEALGIF